MTPENGAPDYVALPVHGGGVTLVDAAQRAALPSGHFCWSKKGYVLNGRFGRVHRLVTGAPKGMEVHHRNGIKWDNRNDNLQVLTAREHLWLRPRRLGNPWGYRGVRLNCHGGKFSARVYLRGTSYRAASRNTPLEAAFAYDDMVLRIGAPKWWRNFPHRMRRARVARWIQAAGPRLFSVDFHKRVDATLRHMVCRTGVRVGLVGGKSTYDPASHGLVLVWDVQKRAHRTIPLEGILVLATRRRKWRVIDEVQ
jgi:hypothetical protein